MKTALAFILFVLIATSCDDVVLGEKIVNRQKIDIKIYYENTRATRVSDGLLLSFQKSYTNGDTANCEVFAKRENILTKIDLNGNKLWERVNNTSPYLGNSFLEDRAGFLWQYEGSNKLIKFDKLLNFVSENKLDFSQFVKTGNSYVNRVVMAKSGKIVGLGNTSLGKDNYKPFICEIGEQGVEKLQEISNSGYTDLTRMVLSELPDGTWFVVQYTPDYAKTTTSLTLSYYDKAFQLIKSGQSTLKTASLNEDSFVFRQNKLFLIVSEDNEKKIVAYDADFKRSEAKLTTGNVALGFVPSANSLFVYDFNKTIYRIDEQTLDNQKYVSLNVPLISTVSAIDSAGVTDFVGIESPYLAKSKIVFSKTNPANKQAKQLYESDYSRKCIEFYFK